MAYSLQKPEFAMSFVDSETGRSDRRGRDVNIFGERP